MYRNPSGKIHLSSCGYANNAEEIGIMAEMESNVNEIDVHDLKIVNVINAFNFSVFL